MSVKATQSPNRMGKVAGAQVNVQKPLGVQPLLQYMFPGYKLHQRVDQPHETEMTVGCSNCLSLQAISWRADPSLVFIMEKSGHDTL